MSQQTRDPVHGVRYAFERQGEDLVVETWMEPGGGLPEHLHPTQTEHWSVVEGEVLFGLDGNKRVLTPGDGVVVVEPGTKHSLTSTGAGEAHLHCLVMPAGKLEEFLTDSAAAARDGLFAKGGIPKSLKGARWAATFLERHGDEVVMSFPPAFVQRAMIALLGR